MEKTVKKLLLLITLIHSSYGLFQWNWGLARSQILDRLGENYKKYSLCSEEKSLGTLQTATLFLKNCGVATEKIRNFIDSHKKLLFKFFPEPLSDSWKITVYKEKQKIGELKFLKKNDHFFVQGLQIESEHRNQGVATALILTSMCAIKQVAQKKYHLQNEVLIRWLACSKSQMSQAHLVGFYKSLGGRGGWLPIIPFVAYPMQTTIPLSDNKSVH